MYWMIVHLEPGKVIKITVAVLRGTMFRAYKIAIMYMVTPILDNKYCSYGLSKIKNSNKANFQLQSSLCGNMSRNF